MENKIDEYINKFKKSIYALMDEVNCLPMCELTNAQNDFVEKIECTLLEYNKKRHEERLGEIKNG